tara:strand:+ start:286 stop:390 length:105 start_codon:yes stop_codon:yes gene_type:complete
MGLGVWMTNEGDWEVGSGGLTVWKVVDDGPSLTI